MPDNEHTEDSQSQEQMGEQTNVPPSPDPQAPPGFAPKRTPEEEDTFMRVTRKALLSTEKVIEASYQKTRQAFASSDPRASVNFIDGILNWVRELFPPTYFQPCWLWLVRGGHMAIIAAQLMVLIIFALGLMRLGHAALLFKGIAYALALVALQYTADKLLRCGDAWIRTLPTRTGYPAVLNSFSLLVEIVGILVCLGALIWAGRLGQWSLLLFGVGAWVFADAIAYVALFPPLLQISIDDGAKPADEAINLLSLPVKAAVRIMPVVFGIGSLIGAAGLVFATVRMLFISGDTLRESIALPGWTSLLWVIACAGFPLACYVLFMIHALLVDLVRAVLQLPGKLDNLPRK